MQAISNDEHPGTRARSWLPEGFARRRSRSGPRWAAISALLTLLGIGFATSAPRGDFRFAILGDRTGSAQPGVYQEVWKEMAAWKPDMVINVGDTIEGGNDATANAEWNALRPLFNEYRRFPLYLIPGNHDIWSEASRRAWERQTKHNAHYSFDFGDVHFTVLDNSQSEGLPGSEMRFLAGDLERAQKRPIRMVFFHKPFWLVPVMLGGDFPLHRLALKYRVRYIVSGHTHRFARFEKDGVVYLMVGSSGAHLRASRFKDGWFFHHVRATVAGGKVHMVIKEVDPPFGSGRTFTEQDWGSGPVMRDR